MPVIAPLIGNFTALVNGNLTGHAHQTERLSYRSMSAKEIYERVEKRLRAVGKSANAASREANKPDAIRNLKRAITERGPKAGPNIATLEALAPVLETTVEWLLTGGGPESVEPQKATRRPLVGSFDPDAPVAHHDADLPRAAVSDQLAFGIERGEIPQIEGTLGLGNRTEAPVINVPIGQSAVLAARVIDTWKIPEGVLRRRIRGSLGAVHILECEGDSMEPRIKNGDFVFIDTSRRQPSPPGIFAIHDGYSQTLKRLEIVPNTDPPRIKIIPENDRHSTYELLLEEVNIIGRYVCRLTMD